VIFYRYEVPLAPIHSEQIRDHLPGYGQRRSIGIAFLRFGFIDQCQFMVLFGRQFRGFHQYTLDMFVALFRKRSAYDLVGGALFVTAKPAITDGLFDRGEARKTPPSPRPRSGR